MEKKAPRSFSWQFKEEVAKRMLSGESPTRLSRELSIVLSKLYKWRDQYRQGGSGVWPRAEGRPDGALPASPAAVKESESRPENRVAELERKIGKQQLVIDFFATSLAQSRGRTPADEVIWRDRLYPYLREVAVVQGSLTISEMCDWMRVSRLSFYRYWQEKAPAEEETALRDRLQLLSLENPRYGSRRLAQLLKRTGENVNRKRVQRIMQEDNLLCLRGKKFVMTTTDSNHPWGFYPNLARELTLTNVNQLWVADITYIRLREEFAYLAVVLDAHSRRIIGWALEPHIRSELAGAALTHALRDRPVPPGLIHHSDRGVQYCCGEYIHRLRQYEIRPSMSRKGNPYDNAKAESFMKTLKFEQVDGRVYASIDEARQHIIPFLECYNQQRLHSALTYRSPSEYEADLLPPREGWNEGAGI